MVLDKYDFSVIDYAGLSTLITFQNEQHTITKATKEWCRLSHFVTPDTGNAIQAFNLWNYKGQSILKIQRQISYIIWRLLFVNWPQLHSLCSIFDDFTLNVCNYQINYDDYMHLYLTWKLLWFGVGQIFTFTKAMFLKTGEHPWNSLWDTCSRTILPIYYHHGGKILVKMYLSTELE